MVQLSGAISLIGGFPALAGVDLTIYDGEIVVLRGPNGAGKSTLLRLCAGLAPLSGGVGMVLGHDLSRREERRMVRRETGLLAHQTFLYDELTVEENLHFWARANRADPSTVEPILDRLDLGGRLRTVKIAALSAGQRRRASVAVMVCRRPKLWLLDEPHAGLDHAGRNFIDEIVRHAVRFGATVMIASHDHERVSNLATRTIHLVGGTVTNAPEQINVP
jgi:heme ABC exporter ATP-binding subunit CcmA